MNAPTFNPRDHPVSATLYEHQRQLTGDSESQPTKATHQQTTIPVQISLYGHQLEALRFVLRVFGVEEVRNLHV